MTLAELQAKRDRILKTLGIARLQAGAFFPAPFFSRYGVDMTQKTTSLNFCPRCGMDERLPHRTTADCIAYLHAFAGDLERRVARLAAEPPAERREQSSARRERQFLAPVLLDGERLPLCEAAARLGLRPKVLYERIYRRLSRNRQRTGARLKGEAVDVRALGADLVRRPWATRRAAPAN